MKDHNETKKYSIIFTLIAVVIPTVISIYLNTSLLKCCEESNSLIKKEGRTENLTTSTTMESKNPEILGESTSASPLFLSLSCDRTEIQTDDPRPDAQNLNYVVEVQNSSECSPKTADIMLILDRSGSMTGDPLDNAKLASVNFVNLLSFPENQIGLVSFASKAKLESKLTTNKDHLISKIDNLKASGSTNTADAIIKAREELLSPRHNIESQPIIILLADGKWNTGTNPVPEAQIAKDAGIRIIVIALGQLWDDDTIPINENDLLQISSEGEGNYYTSTDSSELLTIYETIFENINENVADTDIWVDLTEYKDKVELLSVSNDGEFLENKIQWHLPAMSCESSETLNFSVVTTCLLEDEEKISLSAQASQENHSPVASQIVETTVHAPIFKISEIEIPDTADPGESVNFALKVENIGSGKAYGLTVIDTYPNDYLNIETNSITDNGRLEEDKIIWEDKIGTGEDTATLLIHDETEEEILEEEPEEVETEQETETEIINANFSGILDTDMPEDIGKLENTYNISSSNGCFHEERKHTILLPRDSQDNSHPNDEEEREPIISIIEDISEEEDDQKAPSILEGKVLNANTASDLAVAGQNIATIVLLGSAFIILSIGGFLILTRRKN